MYQPVPQYGESAARYLRGNVTVGVGINDDRIKVAGNLPAPNSSLSRSRITPFHFATDPKDSGYHLELNMTRRELALLAVPDEVGVTEGEFVPLGNFLARALINPSESDFFLRRIQLLLRDGGIQVFPFEGATPRGGGEFDNVPYLCFNWKITRLEPDPQPRTSQLAHAIRRLNDVFDLISKKGFTLFREKEEYRKDLVAKWANMDLPQEEFDSLWKKLQKAFTLKLGPKALTYDAKPILTEVPGRANLRLVFEKGIAEDQRREVLSNIQIQIRDLNRFISEQVGDPRVFGGSLAANLVPGNDAQAYIHFELKTPVGRSKEIDAEQALWLTDSLYDDFVELLRPFELHFRMDYSKE